MRSFLRSDLAAGLLVAVALVAAVAWVAVVIDRHAEEHGHYPPLAMIDVELAHRGDQKDGGEGCGGLHGCSVGQARPANHVRSATE